MAFAYAEDPSRMSADRVRRSTSMDLNRQIDQETDENIGRYSNSSPAQIARRMEELDREWDVERALEVKIGRAHV